MLAYGSLCEPHTHSASHTHTAIASELPRLGLCHISPAKAGVILCAGRSLYILTRLSITLSACFDSCNRRQLIARVCLVLKGPSALRDRCHLPRSAARVCFMPSRRGARHGKAGEDCMRRGNLSLSLFKYCGGRHCFALPFPCRLHGRRSARHFSYAIWGGMAAACLSA